MTFSFIAMVIVKVPVTAVARMAATGVAFKDKMIYYDVYEYISSVAKEIF